MAERAWRKKKGGKNEIEKKKKEKEWKKKFQWEDRTRDLLICRRPSLPHSNRLRDWLHVLNPPTYTANLNGHELRVASLAALAPLIIKNSEIWYTNVSSFTKKPYLIQNSVQLFPILSMWWVWLRHIQAYNHTPFIPQQWGRKGQGVRVMRWEGLVGGA